MAHSYTHFFQSSTEVLPDVQHPNVRLQVLISPFVLSYGSNKGSILSSEVQLLLPYFVPYNVVLPSGSIALQSRYSRYFVPYVYSCTRTVQYVYVYVYSCTFVLSYTFCNQIYTAVRVRVRVRVHYFWRVESVEKPHKDFESRRQTARRVPARRRATMALGTLVAAYAKRGGRPPTRRAALAAIAALAVVEFTWLMRRRADDRVVADADAARVAGAPSRAGAARAVGAAGKAGAMTRDGGGDRCGRAGGAGGASGCDSSSSSSSSNATDGAGKRRRGSDRASVASSPPRAFASASDAIVDWWAGEGGKHPLSVSSPAAAAVGLAGCCGGQRAPSSRLATSSRVHRSVVVESRDA